MFLINLLTLNIMNNRFDIVIIGAGAAGLFAAASLANAGLKIAVLDKNAEPGVKLMASGGGKCNFSNRNICADNYAGENPMFVSSALARFKTTDFIKILNDNKIPYEERGFGRLFLTQEAAVLKNLFESICKKHGINFILKFNALQIKHGKGLYTVLSADKNIHADNLIIACGGLPLGGTDFCFKAAKDLGLKTVAPKPALLPLITNTPENLAGQSLTSTAAVKDGKKTRAFTDGLVFTHKGLGGPAIYQASLYLNEGEEFTVDFLPGVNLENEFALNKGQNISFEKFLAKYLPKKLAEYFAQNVKEPLSNCPAKTASKIIDGVKHAKFCVQKTEHYKQAEVMKGGLSTDGFSSKTMECKTFPGLYAAGEALDITGQLGGYNLHWAWASAYLCSLALKEKYAKQKHHDRNGFPSENYSL